MLELRRSPAVLTGAHNALNTHCKSVVGRTDKQWKTVEMPGLRVRAISKRRCQVGDAPHWDEKAQALLYVDSYAGYVNRLDPETP
ncbi:hypothetical protein HPB48_019428 [Haemaphysalis longicornis]|uniref:Uncharacterized protein n=1 Tax=Haemaphysalis longicornis TaxID=44386 RepID=A0A9J6FR70_HAELO|nr:hypothetical protein HPB48_019428 [Haemaphysalis longicornis]